MHMHVLNYILLLCMFHNVNIVMFNNLGVEWKIHIRNSFFQIYGESKSKKKNQEEKECDQKTFRQFSRDACVVERTWKHVRVALYYWIRWIELLSLKHNVCTLIQNMYAKYQNISSFPVLDIQPHLILSLTSSPVLRQCCCYWDILKAHLHL